MKEDKVILEERVLTRVLLLDAKVSGIVTGFLCGVGLFLATNWLVLKGGVEVGKHLSLINQYFPGYNVTFLGSFIGLAYGFAVGYVIGYFIAWVYNLVLRLRPGRNDIARSR
jgi:hypothetical protein